MQKKEYEQMLNGAFTSLTIGILSAVGFFSVAELFARSNGTAEKFLWAIVALVSCGSMAWHTYSFFVLFGEAERRASKNAKNINDD